ncbi:CsbD family protein [Actinomycetospora termitidis]|uniref:CsbD family protein n=1 Tax=Actinomycetospora termitidis TaxID=3053470 RepID=A0ABT7MGS4_9PSEU|nr:CsbD family protein [Actinomycetospora sp. Odt1-22]MDL5159871.1 CsbD family protein [Actinomycetospora sp. Odt1-22]
MAENTRDQDTSAEDLKGRLKEAVGAVTGADSVAREGQAQQGKASKEDEARRKEQEAEQARAQAERKSAQEK